MKQRGARRRGFINNAVHLGKRACGTVDHFLLSHGAQIKRFTEAAAPVVAANMGAYGPAAGAVLGVLGEASGGYAALRKQVAG